MREFSWISPDMRIDEVLRVYPETEEVLSRYFGQGALKAMCSLGETVESAARLFRRDLKGVLADLNGAVEPGL